MAHQLRYDWLGVVFTCTGRQAHTSWPAPISAAFKNIAVGARAPSSQLRSCGAILGHPHVKKQRSISEGDRRISGITRESCLANQTRDQAAREPRGLVLTGSCGFELRKEAEQRRGGSGQDSTLSPVPSTPPWPTNCNCVFDLGNGEFQGSNTARVVRNWSCESEWTKRKPKSTKFRRGWKITWRKLEFEYAVRVY